MIKKIKTFICISTSKSTKFANEKKKTLHIPEAHARRPDSCSEKFYVHIDLIYYPAFSKKPWTSYLPAFEINVVECSRYSTKTLINEITLIYQLCILCFSLVF